MQKNSFISTPDSLITDPTSHVSLGKTTIISGFSTFIIAIFGFIGMRTNPLSAPTEYYYPIGYGIYSVLLLLSVVLFIVGKRRHKYLYYEKDISRALLYYSRSRLKKARIIVCILSGFLFLWYAINDLLIIPSILSITIWPFAEMIPLLITETIFSLLGSFFLFLFCIKDFCNRKSTLFSSGLLFFAANTILGLFYFFWTLILHQIDENLFQDSFNNFGFFDGFSYVLQFVLFVVYCLISFNRTGFFNNKIRFFVLSLMIPSVVLSIYGIIVSTISMIHYSYFSLSDYLGNIGYLLIFSLIVIVCYWFKPLYVIEVKNKRLRDNFPKKAIERIPLHNIDNPTLASDETTNEAESIATAKNPIFCRKCGEKLIKDSEYCVSCGTRINL